MDAHTLNTIVNFTWGIADDCLRDIYVRGKYRDVMRILSEGTITMFEDEIPSLSMISDHDNVRAAINDIGNALYMLRTHIRRLQCEHYKYALLSGGTVASAKAAAKTDHER